MKKLKFLDASRIIPWLKGKLPASRPARTFPLPPLKMLWPVFLFASLSFFEKARVPSLALLAFFSAACLIRKNPVFLWIASSRLFRAVFIGVAFLYAWLVTHGTWHFWERELYGQIFDILAERLTSGHLTLQKDFSMAEGYLHKGELYSYFGIFPVLWHMLLNGLTHRPYAQWARFSCYLSSLGSVLIFAYTTASCLYENPRWGSRAKKITLALFVVGFALGSPLFFILSTASIWHESILWALFWSLTGLHSLRNLLARDLYSPGDYFLLSLSTAGAILSRPNLGTPLLVSFGAISIILYIRFVSQSLKNISEQASPLHVAFATGSLIVLGTLVFQAWYNFVRFGSIFIMQPLTKYEAFLQFPPEFTPPVFDFRRLPSAFQTYLGWGAQFLSGDFPFIIMVPAPSFNFAFIFYELSVPLTLSSPWLLATAAWGLIRLFRRKRFGLELGLALPFLLSPIFTMMYYHQGERYVADFFPALLYPSLFVATDVRPMKNFTRRILVGSIFSLLVVYSCYVSVFTTFYAVAHYSWPYPSEFRRYVTAELGIIDHTIKIFFMRMEGGEARE